MEKIAILFAPAKGNTEKIARLIQTKIGSDKIDMILIKDDSEPDILMPYTKLIFGISTVGRDSWNSKYKKIGWDLFMPKIENTDLKGKTVAVFGLGDHLLYTDNFVDSMGALANQLIQSGAELVGQTPVDGYTFSNSEAIVDGMFLGLPIDEDNEPEATEQRINVWLKGISDKLGF